MLHTFNKAWANIIINQSRKDITKQFIFVLSDEDYSEAVELMQDAADCRIGILKASDLDTDTCYERISGEFPMCDDILISHDVHNVFLKSFLNKHCKRKCC